MKIEQIQSVLHAERVGEANPEIKHLLTDSRLLGAEPEATLFFALRTDKNDGARYIPELYAKGVRAFVVNKSTFETGEVDLLGHLSPSTGGAGEGLFLLVPDTLTALQDLAAYKRSLYPNAQVIGITGSNGKTVVKEWLYELLKTTTASPVHPSRTTRR